MKLVKRKFKQTSNSMGDFSIGTKVVPISLVNTIRRFPGMNQTKRAEALRKPWVVNNIADSYAGDEFVTTDSPIGYENWDWHKDDVEIL